MANEKLIRVDFCKGFKVAKALNPGAPLDIVEPLGIAPLSVEPLVSHEVASGKLLSQINQEKASWLRSFLPAPGSQDDRYPHKSAMIAGLRGTPALTGAATYPYPAPLPQYEITAQIGGIDAIHVLDGTRQSNPAGTWQTRGLNGAPSLGFGEETGLTYDLILGTQRFEGNVLYGGRPRSYHRYNAQFRLPYSPGKEPLTLAYQPLGGYYYIADHSVGNATGATTEMAFHEGRLYTWDCPPCLTDTNGTIHDPASEPNGPLLHRQYADWEFGDFTMPDYATRLPLLTYDLPFAHLRSLFVVYATPRVTGITLNGVAGSATGITSLPIVNDGSVTAFPGHRFTQRFEFAIAGNETTFTFQISGYSVTTQVATVNLGTLFGTTGYRCYEAWADIYLNGHPEPDY